MGTPEVLVVGAGPTGLVMAAELALRGVKVRLVDRTLVRSTRSRALAVQARSLELFQKMGIADELLLTGQRTLGMQLYVDGKRAAELDLTTIGADDTPFPFLLFVSQADTEAALIRLAERLGVVVERSTELTDFTQDESGVTATLTKGGAEETVRCQYLIGCDGAHSKVRRALGLRFDGAPYDQEFVLADCRLGDWPHVNDRLQIFLSMNGFLAHFPLRGSDASRLILSRTGRREAVTSEATTEAPVTREEVEEATRQLTGTKVRLEEPQWLANFRLHHRGVDRYREGRAFVAGDAAHIHSPAGGQGMNTGIQDAYNLAWKLALVLRGQAPDALLDSYHDERFPVGQFLLKRTDRFFQLIVTSNRALLRLRNHFAPIIARFVLNGPEAARRRAFRFISQLGIHYEPSAWIGAGAGRRAADAPVGETTLFALMRGPKHQLLCFATPPPEKASPLVETHVLGRAEAPLAFARYGFESAGSGYCLVRPDGYVAYRSEGPGKEGLGSFLARLDKNRANG